MRSLLAVSAVHRHVTTGIWLLTNSGTDGLPPDQAKEYGEPEAASTTPTRLFIDPQEWDLSPGCSHLDVPGEAGKTWSINAAPTGPHEGMPAGADAVASRQRRSRRAWGPDASMNHASMNHAVQESRKSRSRSRRDHLTNEFVHVKSRRKHRRSGRRETEAMDTTWTVNFQDTFHPDGLGYVHGPPEPEQQHQQDQLDFTLVAQHFVTVGQASSGEVKMLQCCGSASGVIGAEVPTVSCSKSSAPSLSTGVWQDVSAAAETAIASRTSSNGNSQLGTSEDLTQKMPAAGSSTHTYTEDLDNFAEEPSCGIIGLSSHHLWALDEADPMAITAAQTHHRDPCAFDPVKSYKIYHARQDDDDVLQTEADRRRPRCDSWDFNCTEFNSTGSGDGDRNITADRSTAMFNVASCTTPAVAVPVISTPPQPPPLLATLLDLLQLPGVYSGDASVSTPVFQEVDPPQGSTSGWTEQQPGQQPKSTEAGWWDALSS